MGATITPTPTRHLPLEGTYNVRDTGGYATTDGHVTRWQTLLRGDALQRLTAAGQAALVDAGLHTVIDLRRDTELAQAPNVFATSDAVRYINISLIEATPHEAEAAPRTLASIYEGIITASHDRIREIFATLAAPGAFPALVHCTAGKDRTGIIIALLLGVAGVPTETIVADYALTEQYLAGEWVEQIRARVLASGGDWAAMALLMGSPAELMRQTLADIETHHGGVPQYLRAIGIPEETLTALRAALITDAATGEDAHPTATATVTTTTFVHLTDTHFQPETGTFFGLDTRQRFHDTLDLLRERGVLAGSTVVISGDLVHDGTAESYARLRPAIEALRTEGVTVLLALGNHDNRAVFRTAMLDQPESDGTEKYHYTAMLGDLRLIVLDSHELGTHDGALGEAQRAWLKAELATPAPGGTVLVVHHPPTDAPMPALTGHLLMDADALREIIADTDVIGILAGHTHVAAAELFAGVPSVTAPGTAFLLDVAAAEGMRFLDGGGINLITVRDRVMKVAPVSLPRSQRELYHHHPGDPLTRLVKADAHADADTDMSAPAAVEEPAAVAGE